MTSQGYGVVRPLPGDGVIAHTGGLMLVCQAGEAVESLLAALHETASSGGDGLALARRVAQALATTMAAEMPSCAVAGPCSGGVAVLVSGSAEASVDGGPDGVVRLSGRDALTWTDRLVPGPATRIELRLPGAGEPMPHARLDGGVVGGAGLVCDLTATGPLPPPPRALGGVPAALPAAAPEPLPAAPAPSPSPLDAAPQPAPPPAPPQPAVPPAPAPVSGPSSGPSNPPGLLSGPMPQTGQQLSALAGEDKATGGDDALAPQPSGDGGPGSTFEPAPAATGSGQDSSEREATEYLPEPEPTPMVYGVDCKNDHFNDPRVPYCAVCGAALDQRQLVPYKGPRPPLGVLVLDDGMTLRLDSDYLLGRDPERAAEVLSGEARPAKITSPDGSVSRRHLRVKLDGWDVNLIDLGSVNGTQVQPPGDPNFYDIPPNEPVAILPGTTVRIGVSRTMRYESHRTA